jgi:hypothetical protein
MRWWKCPEIVNADGVVGSLVSNTAGHGDTGFIGLADTLQDTSTLLKPSFAGLTCAVSVCSTGRLHRRSCSNKLSGPLTSAIGRSRHPCLLICFGFGQGSPETRVSRRTVSCSGLLRQVTQQLQEELNSSSVRNKGGSWHTDSAQTEGQTKAGTPCAAAATLATLLVNSLTDLYCSTCNCHNVAGVVHWFYAGWLGIQYCPCV